MYECRKTNNGPILGDQKNRVFFRPDKVRVFWICLRLIGLLEEIDVRVGKYETEKW